MSENLAVNNLLFILEFLQEHKMSTDQYNLNIQGTMIREMLEYEINLNGLSYLVLGEVDNELCFVQFELEMEFENTNKSFDTNAVLSEFLKNGLTIDEHHLENNKLTFRFDEGCCFYNMDDVCERVHQLHKICLRIKEELPVTKVKVDFWLS